ncbi:MAG TPA: glycosyltransferase family 2 protein, partial [Pseudonocardiaceae bacterium]
MGHHRPGAGPRGPLPDVRTAPVLTVLVCHDGAAWLPDVLAALGALATRPRYVLAVDTGSTDETPALLAAALDGRLLDGVLTLPAGTGFGDAVRHAVERAEDRWGDPGSWVWLLHDDSAPAPDCLDVLLGAAGASPSVALLGPLCLDWDDPRLVVEAGLSTDAAGHRQTGLGAAELDPGLLGGGLAQNTEVLAVGSAGALVRRDVWNALGGFDPAMPLLRDDLDLGWRANRADHLVLVVPAARIRHAAAGSRGERPVAALPPWLP